MNLQIEPLTVDVFIARERFFDQHLNLIYLLMVLVPL